MVMEGLLEEGRKEALRDNLTASALVLHPSMNAGRGGALSAMGEA
jgi:hypothetical protein